MVAALQLEKDSPLKNPNILEAYRNLWMRKGNTTGDNTPSERQRFDDIDDNESLTTIRRKRTKGSGGGDGGGQKPPKTSSKTKSTKANITPARNLTSWILGGLAAGSGTIALGLYTLGERIIPHDKLREWGQIVSSVGFLFFTSLFGAEALTSGKSDDETEYTRRDV